MWKPKNPKSIALIKLGLWSGIVVWMAFFLTFSILVAYQLGNADIYGSGIRGDILSWVTPIWVVFTALLTVAYMMRFVSGRLGGSSGK